MQSNTGSPTIFSGPRARFSVGGQVMGYAGGVSGEETIDYEPVDVIDLLTVFEHVPVAYRCSLNAQVFRVVGNSLKQQRIFPKFDEILRSECMVASLEDNDADSTPIASFSGVRTAGHTFDVTARSIVSENVSFVAIRVTDESGD